METISVNRRNFEIIRLLGKGKGGYSYLATDGNGEFVVKKIHHEPCTYYHFGNKLEAERSDYEKLRRIGITMPKMLDIDAEREHILKEYIPGDTIFDMVKSDVDVSFYIEQIKKMCEKLYRANTNIDYFPTNFIPYNGIVYYVDYECNDYMEQWNFENWGIKYWSKTEEFLKYLAEENI